MDVNEIHKKLDQIKHIQDLGPERTVEYWMARDLQVILGYEAWQNFESVIARAMHACETSGKNPDNHFNATIKEIRAGKGAIGRRQDYRLTRYACYLVTMNGDPSQKLQVGLAQTYFAVQTRRQELDDQLTYEQKRLIQRERVRNANKYLSNAAKKAGVKKFGVFQDAGYRGLYQMSYKEIKRTKGIPDQENLLDCSGRAELAANEFRITQTEERLTNEKIQGEMQATNTHHKVGTKVRQTIKELGGTMPEKLVAEPSIKRLTQKKQKQLPPKDE